MWMDGGDGSSGGDKEELGARLFRREACALFTEETTGGWREGGREGGRGPRRKNDARGRRGGREGGRRGLWPTTRQGTFPPLSLPPSLSPRPRGRLMHAPPPSPPDTRREAVFEVISEGRCEARARKERGERGWRGRGGGRREAGKNARRKLSRTRRSKPYAGSGLVGGWKVGRSFPRPDRWHSIRQEDRMTRHDMTRYDERAGRQHGWGWEERGRLHSGATERAGSKKPKERKKGARRQSLFLPEGRGVSNLA